MRSALIHRARLLTRSRGTRSAQGEHTPGDPVPGPWFRARLMERGGPAAKSRRRENATDAKVARGFELLADAIDENGAPVVLSASAMVETDCPILESPTLVLSGKPEKLNNGRRFIGWDAYAVLPEDAA